MYRTAANRGRSPRTLHAMRKVLSKRRGSTLAIVMIALVVVVISAYVIFGTSIVSGEDEQENILTYGVTKGPLVVTVTEDGNLESASNKELKSQVKGGSSILFIVEDGTRVDQGDQVSKVSWTSRKSSLKRRVPVKFRLKPIGKWPRFPSRNISKGPSKRICSFVTAISRSPRRIFQALRTHSNTPSV